MIWQNRQTGDVSYWLMNGTTRQDADVISHITIPLEWKVVGVADMNGNGKPDLLWRNTQTGDVVVWYMDNTVWSGNWEYIAQGVPLDWKPIGLTDLNGDLLPDLLWQNTTSGDVVVWYLNGPVWSGDYDYIARNVPLDWKLSRAH